MKHLISMTDFVLEQRKKGKGTVATVLNYIFKYADFLKQPLEIWMFVTCDEDGNVLEEPKAHFPTTNNQLEETIFKQNKEYREAKERVLFEGLDLDAVNHHIKMGRNIEYLANFGTLKLTQTAIKQLGL